MSRPVILVFNRFYAPGFKAGGPVRTIVNMVERLGDEFDFRVVTQDRDLGDAEPYEGIVSGDWHGVSKAKVCYLSPGQVTVSRLAGIVADVAPDAIYLNSFFDPLFTQKLLLARFFRRIPFLPLIVAPRGEFSEGALGLKAPKKKLYRRLASWIGLYSNVTWQASSERELGDIRDNFPGARNANIRVALNLAPVIEVETAETHFRAEDSPLRVCVISRISPMKNLDYSLRLLQDVWVPVIFTVYGPSAEPDYWKICEDLIAKLPPYIKVEWKGAVDPSQVNENLRQHDLFLLPTRGENYGHVIYEALAAGLPVLISDQTPWQSVEELGVGWSLPLHSPAAFIEVIERVATWTGEKRVAVSRAAIDYANSVSGDDDVLADNRQLFLDAINT